jgi:hypothetical protein
MEWRNTGNSVVSLDKNELPCLGEYPESIYSGSRKWRRKQHETTKTNANMSPSSIIS